MPGLNRRWDASRDPLAALRDGDPGPFEEFVRTATPRLLGFFRRLGAGQDEAEDMTQETFLKLHQNAPRYRDEERFGPFTYRVARNVWIDRRRRAAARPRPVSLDGEAGADPQASGSLRLVDSLPSEASEAGDPGRAVDRAEDAERLRAAVAELPEHHRLVFELGVVQELSYADVSAALDIPVGTVKSRMFHAVRRLRERLAEPEETP